MGRSGRLAPPICVVLDTNMLMMLHAGLDVFREVEELLEARVEFVAPRPVVEELERLASKAPPSLRRAAGYALRILSMRNIRVTDIPRPTGRVDADIAMYARQRGCFVATNDRGLRRMLREMGVPDIHLRETEHRLEASFIPPSL